MIMKNFPNCGVKSKKYKGPDNIAETTNKSNLIVTVLSKPKLLLLVVAVIIFVCGVISLTSNNFSAEGNYVWGWHEVSIYRIPFNIPNGFEETKHEGSSTYWETVYFYNKNTQEEFSIRVFTDINLDLSGKHIKSKY